MLFKIKILALIYCLVLGILHPVLAQAETGVPVPDKPGTDIIILLDQSGSMSGRNKGSKAHPEPNDKHGYRIDAIRNFINKLEAQSKQSIARGRPHSHRIAVVEFGSDAQVLVPWFLIDGEGLRKDALHNLTKLKASLEEKNLGDTHLIAAFHKALELFKAISFGADTIHERKPAIYLITDGKPYSEINPYLRSGRFYSDRYWRDLKKLINHTKKEASNSGRKLPLYVLAMNDAFPYWESVGPNWEKLSKIARQLDYNHKLNSYIDEVIKDLINIQYNIVQNEFDCPCYLSKVHFIVYQQNPGATIQIYKPDGQKVFMNKHIVERANTYIIYGFTDPEKGIWQFGGNKNTEIRVEQYYDTVRFAVPGIHTRIPSVPTKIRWFVSSSRTGEPFIDKPGCPYLVESTIIAPNGKTYTLKMHLVQDGIFESIKEFQPETFGIHKALITGYSPTVKSGDQIIFEGAEQPFEVTDSVPLVINLIKPESISLKFGKAATDIGIEITDFRNPSRVLPLTELSKSPEKLLMAQFLNAANETISPKIFLQPNASLGPNALYASIKINDRFRPLTAVLRNGKADIKFSVNTEYLNPKYFIYRFKGPYLNTTEPHIGIPFNESILLGVPFLFLILWLLIDVVLILKEGIAWSVLMLRDYIIRVKRAKLCFHKNFDDPAVSGFSKSVKHYRRIYFGNTGFGFETFFPFSLMLKLILMRKSIPWPEMQKRLEDAITGFRVTRSLLRNEIEVYYFKSKTKKEDETMPDYQQSLSPNEPESIPDDDEYSLTYLIE